MKSHFKFHSYDLIMIGMGPLQNTVHGTKHFAGCPTLQGGKKNMETTSFKQLIPFFLKSPLLCLPSTKVFSHHVTVFMQSLFLLPLLMKQSSLALFPCPRVVSPSPQSLHFILLSSSWYEPWLHGVHFKISSW